MYYIIYYIYIFLFLSGELRLCRNLPINKSIIWTESTGQQKTPNAEGHAGWNPVELSFISVNPTVREQNIVGQPMIAGLLTLGVLPTNANALFACEITFHSDGALHISESNLTTNPPACSDEQASFPRRDCQPGPDIQIQQV